MQAMRRDSELLCCYLEDGSETAFREIVQRYLPLVYGAALRQLGGDAHEAKDVAQSVFTDLARKARTLVQRRELATWLHTSTRFAAAKVRRARARRQKYESSAEIMNSLHDESPTTADWERLGPLVDDALHELGERDRTLVLLRFFSNRPFAEIGAVQGLSMDAARMRVERALDKLRRALLRRGITSTSAALATVLSTQASPAVPAAVAVSITQAALMNGGVLAIGGGTAWATIFHFMSTTKFIIGGLGVVAVIAIGTAWHEAGVVSDTRQALTDVDRQRVELQARLEEMQSRVDAKASLAEAGEESFRAVQLPANAPPHTSPAPVVQDFGFTPGPKTREEILALRHEQLVKRVEAGERSREALYQELGLDEEQRDKLLMLRIEEAMARRELVNKAIGNTLTDLDARPAAVRAADMKAQSDFFYELRETVGESIAGEIAAFDRAAPVSHIVDRIEEKMTDQNALDRTQLRALRDILAKNSMDDYGQIDPANLQPSALHADARAVLSDEQFQILSHLIDTGVITAPLSKEDYERYQKKIGSR